MSADADCHYGDHTWRGTSQCVRCDARLRCFCGVFVREDRIEAHMGRCPTIARQVQDEYDERTEMLRQEALR